MGSAACIAYDGIALTLTAPTAGQIVLDGTVWLRINHTSGTEDFGYVAFNDAADACPVSSAWRSTFQIPADLATDATYHLSQSVTRTFAVSAGTHTFYIVGNMTSGYDAGDVFWYANASAVFIPD